MLSLWILEIEELIIINSHLKMVHDVTKRSSKLTTTCEMLQRVCFLLGRHFEYGMLDHLQIVWFPRLIVLESTKLLRHLVLVEAVVVI